MSRFRKKQTVVIRKPLSKVDQALRLAKSNRKNIKQAQEFINIDSVVTADTAMNATPQVVYLTESLQVSGLRAPLTSIQIRAVVKQNLTSALVDDYRVDLVLDRNMR